MAKQMKKTLCVLLSVVMAFSCFAVSAFALSGYDNNGLTNDLRVASSITTDKTSYAVGETVNATITLEHLNDDLAGFQAYIAYDAGKLTFQSAAGANGFEFFDENSAPTEGTAVSATDLHNGYGGAAYTASNFASHLGTPVFSNLNVVHIAVLNLSSVAAGTTAVATLSFTTTSAVDSTAIAIVPSNVYKADYGFFDCIVSLSTNGVLASGFCASAASNTFEITGDSAAVYHDITFSWYVMTDGVKTLTSTTVNTKENTMPEAPSVPDYSEGDWDYTFTNWNPALAVATGETSYMALYNGTFVGADYTAYDQAVSAAITKRDGNSNWTDESVAALNAALNTDVSGLGRTSQGVVDAQTTAINNAAAALQEKAAVYTISFDVKGEVSSQDVTAGVVPVAPIVSDYEDNAKFYTFSGWKDSGGNTYAPGVALPAAAGNTTYTAQFSEEWKEYDITFKWHNNQTVVKTHWDEMPVEPTVPDYDDDAHTYTFKNWNPSVTKCAGAATYEAEYNRTTKTYLITFKNEDGSVLQSTRVAYGEMPSYTGATPTKAATAQYTYTFDDWNEELVPVTGSATYTATYNSTLREYIITFMDEDGTTVLQSGKVAYGTIPAYNGTTPTKAADNEFRYTFSKWDNDVVAVTGDATYTATYNSEYIDYEIIFYDEDGVTKLRTQYLHWGEMPEGPTVPGYEKDGKTYTFAAWDPSVVAVAGDTSYTATYSSEFIVYTITFVVNGVSTTQDVNAGTLPTAPPVDNYDDGDYYKEFTGWDKLVVPAAADTTYTAQFSSTFIEADYAAVNAALEAAEAIDKTIYTDESLAVLDAATGAVVKGLGRTEQARVEAFATAITDAIADLEEKPADYAAYNAAVEALEAELAKSDYRPDSIDAVRQKLQAIDEGLNKSLTITYQTTVDTAKAAVEALVNDLVVKADKGDLKSLIDEAQERDANKDKYVDFTNVTSALADAITVYENDNATPEAVSDAIKTLRIALNALVFKDADYTAWNTLVEGFEALELQYYQQDLVDAVKAVLAQVESDKDINYQDTLDDLTAQLQAAIGNLDIIRAWDGEIDFNGEEHEFFYSNLEFEKGEDVDGKTAIHVYLNHPSDTVYGIQVAAFFDGAIASFDHAEAVKGQIIGLPAASEARFDPTDYGYSAMQTPNTLMFMLEFEEPLAPTYASRDHIATLYFNSTSVSGSTMIKAVPLAANTAADASIYSFILTDDDIDNPEEKFIHSEFVQAEFTGIIKAETQSIKTTNPNAAIAAKLFMGGGALVGTENAGVQDGFQFDDVQPGTYEVKISATSALTVTVTNIVVEEGGEVILPEVRLIFGDYNGNDQIDLDDLSQMISLASNLDFDPKADTDGNNVIELSDITDTIYYYGTLAAEQVYTM